MRRLVVALALLTVVTVSAAACSGGDSNRSSPDLAAVHIRLTKLADLERPTAFAVRKGDATLYVTEQVGRVRAVRAGKLAAEPVLDISNEVGSTGTEQGLLGMTFSPDGNRVYLDFTNPAGNTRVVEYTVNGATIDARSSRQLLAIDQPQSNHNGGSLAIGPDGMLYIGSGDGGNAGDIGPGHVAGGNGQSTHTLLGKLLRIDPQPSGGRPYSIPPGNPFANGDGRPEIFALGLRNPWRFSFDRTTGNLWIGDVGQDEWEEIDFVATGKGSGDNFGWNRLEGTHPYSGAVPAETISPIFEYSHSATGGCSVTGGYVYRGSAIPAMQGVYVFADYCAGELHGLTQVSGRRAAEGSLGATTPNITSFGEDGTGELYVLSGKDGLSRIDPA